MTKTLSQRVREQTTRFDASEYLDDPGLQAELLSDALAAGKSRVIAHALGTIARARGMSDIALDRPQSRLALCGAQRGGKSEPRHGDEGDWRSQAGVAGGCEKRGCLTAYRLVVAIKIAPTIARRAQKMR